jgi:hypothetical protein
MPSCDFGSPCDCRECREWDSTCDSLQKAEPSLAALNDLKKPDSIKLNQVQTNDEKVRIKMGELVKKMADEHGLKPRLIFGKGNVKAQRERYKKRVLEEKRFQCKECQKVFADSSGFKNHAKNKICENPKKTPVDRNEKHVCLCGGKYLTRHKKRHSRTKRHQRYETTLG